MKRISRRGSLIVLAVLLLLIGLIWHERWNIYDYFRLYNYHPSAQVVQLADQTTMTSYGRHLFYVYHPSLEGKTDFNTNCPNYSQQSSVLGCTVYERGIYLYNVQDPQLNGVVQVTAAYEMLHVGYQRLSTSQRQHIDQLVQQAYESAAASDPELKSEEQNYLKTEGQSAVANELHSMMGTEVANLPPQLESYYKTYFSNRQAIVSLKNQYQQAFTSRQATAQQLYSQITSIEQQLSNLRGQINTLEADLKDKRQSIDAQRSNVSDVSAFNAEVDSYNNEITQYQSQINTYNQLVAQHNQIVGQYQQIALQENQLIKDIDSHSSTVSPQ